VNWQHLKAFAWLRWRLSVNQWRRGGTLNAVLMIVVTVVAVCTAVPLLVGSFFLGLYLIPKAQPVYLLYAWDGLVLGFLFFWSVGLLAELQRTEGLALSKFLHLPVSASGAFLLNYLSSLVRLSLIVFAPVMFGFAVALVFVKGPLFVPVVGSVAAFLLMITALSYQFQGWLAALMSNPRRRRTVVVTATALIILVAQLPNLINFFAPWGAQNRADRAKILVEELKKLEQSGPAGSELSKRQVDLMNRQLTAMRKENRESAEYLERTARIANTILPVGWLPLGALTAAEGRLLPSILGFLGMGLVGSASLWRGFQATVGQFQGQSTNRNKQPSVAAAVTGATRASPSLLEAHLPGVSEPVSAIALSGFRSLVRSPEAKMMLLTPVIMVPIFGSMLWKQRQSLPESMRPLVATGAMVFMLLGVVQMMGNLFGFDRDGFRVFVLSAAPRRDVLLGKNLAFAPIVLGMGGILLILVQTLSPLRVDHLLAMIPQYVSMYLLFCLCTNLMSIYAPLHVQPGSLKPSNPKMTTVLIQLLLILVLIPVTQAVTLLPLGAEVTLRLLGFAEAVPVCLLLSLVECAVVVLLYCVFVGIQGNDLRAREQRILDVVTSRAP
jgi:hypothetical protein